MKKKKAIPMKSAQSTVAMTGALRVKILFVMQTTNLKIGICGGLMEEKV